MRPSIKETMMTVAKVMSKRSTCARRMVGCVITTVNNQILSTGYNGVPTKWEHCTKVACPGANFASGQGLNSCVAVHAEINALVQCGNVDKAHHIYVTTAPCVSCVKALINTGIKHVWYAEGYADTDDSRNLWLTSDNQRTYEQIA